MASSVSYPLHPAYPSSSNRAVRSEYAELPRAQPEAAQRNGQEFFVTEDEQCDCGRGLAEQLRKHRRQEQKGLASSGSVAPRKSASKRAADKKRSEKPRKSSISSARSKPSSTPKSKPQCTCVKGSQKQEEEGRLSRLSKHLTGIEKTVADYAYQGAEQLGRALSAGRDTLAQPLNRILGKSQERESKSSASQSESESSVAEDKSTSKRKQKQKQKARFDKSARSQSRSDKKIQRVQTPGAKSSKLRTGLQSPSEEVGVIQLRRAESPASNSSRSNSGRLSVSRSESKRRQPKRCTNNNLRVCNSCRKAKPASEFAKSPASKSPGRLSSQTLVEPAAMSPASKYTEKWERSESASGTPRLQDTYSSSARRAKSKGRRGAGKSVERSDRSSKAQRRSKKESRPRNERIVKNLD